MTRSILGKELKEKLVKGLTQISESVICTLGPFGRTVMIKNEDGSVKITKDGVTVADAFKKLEDPVEDLAVQLIKHVSRISAKKVGDGTTTSTLLSYIIAKEGLDVIKNNTNAIEVKKGIDKAIKFSIEYLKKLSKDVVEKEKLRQVATISSNNDESVGELIATALDRVGKDGIVTLEESKTGETYLEIVEGILIDKGYKSPYLVTDTQKMEAILHEPYVFLYNGRISKANQIIPLFQFVADNQKSVLVIAEDIEDEALAVILVNKTRGNIKIAAIKAPEYGERKTQVLEDIAIMTGGKVLSVEKGDNLINIIPSQYESILGKARSITVSKDDTVIIDGGGSADDIKKRLLDIKSQIDNAKSDFERERLQDRVGKMVGGAAVLAVGGLSEVELKEKKDRVEDALYATKAAIDQGVVPGGGVAFLNAYRELLKEESYDIPDQEKGRQIVLKALVEPFKVIISNSGLDAETIDIDSTNSDPWEGYDVKRGDIINMENFGILDATKVVISALENAASVAGAILTTEAGIYQEKEEEAKQDYSQFM